MPGHVNDQAVGRSGIGHRDSIDTAACVLSLY